MDTTNNQIFIDPYDRVHRILMDWGYENGFSDVIIRLNLDGNERNELALFDTSGDFIKFEFVNDWWEGEYFIEINGIIPIGNVEVVNNINKIICINGEIV